MVKYLPYVWAIVILLIALGMGTCLVIAGMHAVDRAHENRGIGDHVRIH